MSLNQRESLITEKNRGTDLTVFVSISSLFLSVNVADNWQKNADHCCKFLLWYGTEDGYLDFSRYFSTVPISAFDRDPHLILSCWIRIRILKADPDQGGKKLKFWSSKT